MKFITAVFLAVLASCATLKGELVAFKNGTVTCLKDAEPSARELGLELITLATADLLQGKSPEDAFADVKGRAEAGAVTRGVPVAACAFDGVIADLEKLLHPTVASGVEAGMFRVDGPDVLVAGRVALGAFEAAHGVTSVRR
jgi:hypothetical protein